MQPGFLFDPQHVGNAFARRYRRILPGAPTAESNRHGCRDQFDVDDRQTGGGQCAHRREHRVVLKMLVVDGVELAETDEVQRVVHLDAQPPVVGQQPAQRPGEAQQIGDVRVDVVGDDKIRGTVFGANRGGQFLVQEGRVGGHATLARGGSDIHRRLDAQARYARSDVLQQVAIIAGDFDHE